MIFGRPVYARAILKAVSFASAPPFVKKNTSMSPGVMAASFAPRRARGSVERDGATLVTFQDVTDTVNVERALRERNEALETADKLKIDFVHHVSYELRSPLTNIIGFAHFLGEPSTGPMTEKQREYLGYINTSTNALLAIINDILDLATIDAGAMKLNLGPVDVRKTMVAAAEGIKDRLVKDGLSLQISAAADVGSFVADERRVRQILFNLLANAVNYNRPSGRFDLSARLEEGKLSIVVSDNGIGIAEKDLRQIFEPFYRGHNARFPQGMGLGLSIARDIVNAHGGTLTAESEVGKGSRFVVSLPV